MLNFFSWPRNSKSRPSPPVARVAERHTSQGRHNGAVTVTADCYLPAAQIANAAFASEWGLLVELLLERLETTTAERHRG